MKRLIPLIILFITILICFSGCRIKAKPPLLPVSPPTTTIVYQETDRELTEEELQKAKQLLYEYDGSYQYMKDSGVLEEYMALGLPEETRKELLSDRYDSLFKIYYSDSPKYEDFVHMVEITRSLEDKEYAETLPFLVQRAYLKSDDDVYVRIYSFYQKFLPTMRTFADIDQIQQQTADLLNEVR